MQEIHWGSPDEGKWEREPGRAGTAIRLGAALTPVRERGRERDQGCRIVLKGFGEADGESQVRVAPGGVLHLPGPGMSHSVTD